MSALRGDRRPRRPIASAHAAAATLRHAARLASKRIIVGYGFWIFLLSDIVMFSAFFATYAVLVGQHGGRAERAGAVRSAQRRARDGLPAALELHLRHRQHRRPSASGSWFYGAMAATFLLGAAFLGLEIAGVRGHGRARAPGRRAARSSRPSSPWSAATACTSPPACCGC